LLVVSGCIEHRAVDITGRGCPCAEGWVCDEATDQCFRATLMRPDSGPRRDSGPGSDAGEVDAAGFDAGGPTPGRIWIEAEAGTVAAPMMAAADPMASGGMYITVMAGLNATMAAPADGIASYTFMSEAGDHKVWGRAYVPDGDSDSFWVRMDGGTWVQWNGINAMALMSWAWDDVHDSVAMGAVQTYTLTAGMHTLEVAYREDGAWLDKILITSDMAYMPTGTGD
jgi:hypothetical protein